MEEEDNVEEVPETEEASAEPSEEPVEDPEAVPDEENPDPEAEEGSPEDEAAGEDPEAEGEAPDEEPTQEPDENVDAEENAKPEDVELEIRDEDEGRPVSSLSKKVAGNWTEPSLVHSVNFFWRNLKIFLHSKLIFLYESCRVKLNIAINLCIKVHSFAKSPIKIIWLVCELCRAAATGGKNRKRKSRGEVRPGNVGLKGDARRRHWSTNHDENNP